MKLFLDANVLLDAYSSEPTRKFRNECGLILTLAGEGKFEAYVSPLSLHLFYHFMRKHLAIGKVKKVIDHLMDVVHVASMSSTTMITAMHQLVNTTQTDLEDLFQYHTAKELGAELIITGDRNFFSRDIKLLTPSEFLKEYGE